VKMKVSESRGVKAQATGNPSTLHTQNNSRENIQSSIRDHDESDSETRLGHQSNVGSERFSRA
jgi:hypothetical protein